MIFREVFDQGQQQRVINMLPFMETFQEKAPTPSGGILQRPENTNDDAASSLLDLSFDSSLINLLKANITKHIIMNTEWIEKMKEYSRHGILQGGQLRLALSHVQHNAT